MRVLFHVLDAGVGGGQLVARRIAEHLHARGDELGLVVGADGPLVAEFESLGAEVELRELAELKRPDAAARSRGLVRRYDVLYSHTSAPGQIVCATAATLAGRPHLAHQHTFPYFSSDRVKGALQRSLFRTTTRGTRFVAVAEHVADGLVSVGVNRARIDLVPNGVPPAGDPVPRSDGPVRVGMVARLDPNKGLETFLEAARAVPDATFTIAGRSGPSAEYERGLRARAADAGVEIVDARGEDFLRTVDIAVLPSAHEGSPLVLLEAMATSRAIVASDIPGVREVLAGDAGLLVSVGDSDALAGAVRTLDDPVTREAYGARARAAVESRYGLDQMLARVTHILEEVARG
jgi:glycosyltransferase involved in cell wall biosynthesis